MHKFYKVTATIFAYCLILTSLLLVGCQQIGDDEPKTPDSIPEISTEPTAPDNVPGISVEPTPDIPSDTQPQPSNDNKEEGNFYINNTLPYTVKHHINDVIVNGQRVDLTDAPELPADYAFVPIEPVLKAVEGNIEWAEDGSAVCTLGGVTTILTPGSSTYNINGYSTNLTYAAIMVEEQLMVHIWLIGQLFEMYQACHSETWTMFIETQTQPDVVSSSTWHYMYWNENVTAQIPAIKSVVYYDGDYDTREETRYAGYLGGSYRYDRSSFSIYTDETIIAAYSRLLQ